MTLLIILVILANFTFEWLRGGFAWATWESATLVPYYLVLAFLVDNHGIGDWTAAGLVAGLIFTAQVRLYVQQEVLGR